jgi:hypothetical protein
MNLERNKFFNFFSTNLNLTFQKKGMLLNCQQIQTFPKMETVTLENKSMFKKFGVSLLLISFLSVGSFVYAQDEEDNVEDPAEAETPAKKAPAEKSNAKKTSAKKEKKAKKKAGKKAKKGGKKAAKKGGKKAPKKAAKKAEKPAPVEEDNSSDDEQ